MANTDPNAINNIFNSRSTLGGGLLGPQFASVWQTPTITMTTTGTAVWPYTQQVLNPNGVLGGNQQLINESLNQYLEQPSLRSPSQNSQQSTAVAEPVEAPERQQVADPGAGDEYFKLATKLGIKSAKVTQARLEAFLHTECMGLYEYSKVAAYMKSIASKEGKVWVWKPLRAKDALNNQTTVYSHDHGRVMGGSVYPHEIPLPVLMSIDKIATAFPEALFMVSDYAVPRPDPFVGVTTREMFEHDGTILIFEKFNEPGFRG